MSGSFDRSRQTRRAFLQNGCLVLTAASLPVSRLLADQDDSPIQIGLVTDLHYADKVPAGSRHYRETLGKLEEAALHFEAVRPSFVVELGDFIDAADSVEVEQRYLRTINERFLGNCRRALLCAG